MVLRDKVSRVACRIGAGTLGTEFRSVGLRMTTARYDGNGVGDCHTADG